MKKLFALLVVAGMVFVSCGTQPEAEVNNDATDNMEQVDQEQPAAPEADLTAEETPEAEAPVVE